jgi:hypothetical protein
LELESSFMMPSGSSQPGLFASNRSLLIDGSEVAIIWWSSKVHRLRPALVDLILGITHLPDQSIRLPSLSVLNTTTGEMGIHCGDRATNYQQEGGASDNTKPDFLDVGLDDRAPG